MKKSTLAWLGNRVPKVNVTIVRPMMLLLLALGSASVYAEGITSIETCPNYGSTVLERVTIKQASGRDVATCFYKRSDNQPVILENYYDQITPLNWVEPKSFNAHHECTEGRDMCKFSVTTLTSLPTKELCIGSLECSSRSLRDASGAGSALIKKNEDAANDVIKKI